MPTIFDRSSVGTLNNPASISTLNNTPYLGQISKTGPNYAANDTIITSNIDTNGPYKWVSATSSGITGGKFNANVVAHPLDIIGTTYFQKFIASSQREFVYSMFMSGNEGLRVNANNGNTVEIGRLKKPEPSSTADHILVEGETPKGQTLEAERFSFKINFYGAIWKFTDLSQKLGVAEIINTINQQVGHHAKALMELDVKETLVSGGNWILAGGATTLITVTEPAMGDMRTIEEFYQNYDADPIVPMNGPSGNTATQTIPASYVMIAPTRGIRALEAKAYDAKTEPYGWRPLSMIPNGGKFHDAELGWVGTSIRVMYSNRAPLFKTGDTVDMSGLSSGTATFSIAIATVFAQNAYTMVGMDGAAMSPTFYSQGGKGGDLFDPLDQIRTIGYKMSGKTIIWDPQKVINYAYKVA